jgi:DNA-binding XRE family transcriptional regulator
MRVDIQRLKIARERLGYSQKRLADLVGIPASTMSKIENGLLSGSQLAGDIAKHLGVHHGWLLGGDDFTPGWYGNKVAEETGKYRAEAPIAAMLAEVLQKIGEQNSEIKYLRNELRETQGRLSRLENGLGGGRSSNHGRAG